jgi:flagella synthesis protein FlgN
VNKTAHLQIESLLDQQIDVARRLAAVLESERAVLSGDSPAAVCEKAAEKMQLLEQFERLDAERSALHAQIGTPAAMNLTNEIAQRWRSLMSLLAACRNANETNGLIVSLKQGQVRQLLDILRGGPAVTYGPQGRNSAHAVRPLARA